jgi:putative acetyltransferase
MRVNVRPEAVDDHRSIERVVRTAFGSDVEARLVAAIRASENYVAELALVAEIDGEIVGHVMISYVTLDDGTTQRPILSLSPLAVAPAHQKLGIGSALVIESTVRADELGEPFVVLEGSPDYYGRLGFEYSVPLGVEISLPSWAPPEAAQLLRLKNYDPSIRGRVIYPPAFAEAEQQ